MLIWLQPTQLSDRSPFQKGPVPQLIKRHTPHVWKRWDSMLSWLIFFKKISSRGNTFNKSGKNCKKNVFIYLIIYSTYINLITFLHLIDLIRNIYLPINTLNISNQGFFCLHENLVFSCRQKLCVILVL